MITMTPDAAAQIKQILADAKEGHLRVFVQGGGCSGLQYGLQIEKEPGTDDTSFEVNGIKVVVDPISAKYLSGVEIDYIDDIIGGGFKFNNPNAVSTCGCGQSFEPK